jgi:hypothetical protein
MYYYITANRFWQLGPFEALSCISLRIITKLCAPVIGVLGMSLASPYVVANSIVPFLGKFIYVQLYMVLGWKTIVEITPGLE